MSNQHPIAPMHVWSANMHWAADITFATHSAAMEAGAVLIARYESFHNFFNLRSMSTKCEGVKVLVGTSNKDKALDRGF